jgi:carbonic anhydrase
MKVDISMLIPKDYGLRNRIVGYAGSDSMPPCTLSYCWYLLPTPFEISAAQLNTFVDPKVPTNNRNVNLGGGSLTLLTADGLFF